MFVDVASQLESAKTIFTEFKRTFWKTMNVNKNFTKGQSLGKLLQENKSSILANTELKKHFTES